MRHARVLLLLACLVGCTTPGIPGLPLPGGWSVGGLHPPPEEHQIIPEASDPYKGIRRSLSWMAVACAVIAVVGVVLRTQTPLGTDILVGGGLGFATCLVLLQALRFWWVIAIAWVAYWGFEMWRVHREREAADIAIDTVDLVKRKEWEGEGRQCAEKIQPPWFRKRVSRRKKHRPEKL